MKMIQSIGTLIPSRNSRKRPEGCDPAVTSKKEDVIIDLTAIDGQMSNDASTVANYRDGAVHLPK